MTDDERLRGNVASLRGRGILDPHPWRYGHTFREGECHREDGTPEQVHAAEQALDDLSFDTYAREREDDRYEDLNERAARTQAALSCRQRSRLYRDFTPYDERLMEGPGDTVEELSW